MRDTREMEGPVAVKPPGGDRDPVARRGQKRGGQTDAVNDSRRIHAVRGAEMSGGGWWVAGVGDVNVDGVLSRERSWGAGVK